MSIRSMNASKSSKGCFPFRTLFGRKKKKKRTAEEYEFEDNMGGHGCLYEELPSVDPKDQLAMCIYKPKILESVSQESVNDWTRKGQLCSSTDKWTSSNLDLIPGDNGFSKYVSTNNDSLTTAAVESARIPVKNHDKTLKEDLEVSCRTTGAGLPICNPVNSGTHETESHYLNLTRISMLCPSGMHLEGQRDVIQLAQSCTCGNRSEYTYETLDGCEKPKWPGSSKLQEKDDEYTKTLFRKTEKLDENIEDNLRFEFQFDTVHETPKQKDCLRNLENDSSCSNSCSVLESKLKTHSTEMNRKECVPLSDNTSRLKESGSAASGYINDHSETGADSSPLPDFGTLMHDSSCSGSDVMDDDAMYLPTASIRTLAVAHSCIASSSAVPSSVKYHAHSVAEANIGRPLRTSSYSSDEFFPEKCSNGPHLPDYSVPGCTFVTQLNCGKSTNYSLPPKCSNGLNSPPDSHVQDLNLLTQLNSGVNSTNGTSESAIKNDTIESDEIDFDYCDCICSYPSARVFTITDINMSKKII